MEGDLRVMEYVKGQIEKGRSNFKKSPKDRITESYVFARLEGLEELIDKFSKKHEAIISEYEKEDLDTSDYIKNDVYDEGYETYLVYKGELKAALKLLSPSRNNDSGSPDTSKESIVRLPKISLPFFSGRYTEWSSFKDLFVSLVHNNAALDDVQRLHYLKTQVKGEAEQLIKHISITQANYIKCWEMLQNRYDNKRFMSNCILKRLFGQRTMAGESGQVKKDLLDTSSDCLHELSNLGIKVESWDIIIIYILSSKLDAETRKQWELYVNNSCEDLPSFAQFKEFLESRFRALEFVKPSTSKGKSKPNFNQNNATKVLHATSNPNVICPHRNENHKLYSCGKFAKEDVASRYDIVKSLGLCFNCLGNNHTGKFCRVFTKCRICKGKHHTMFHGNSTSLTVAVGTEAPGNEEIQPEPPSETMEATNIANHFVTGKVHSQTLLATALVKAESKTGNPQILRALLDQGSQATFISEAAVQLLRLNKVAAKSSISGLGGKSGLTSKYMVMVNMQSLCDRTFKLQVKAHVLNTITSIQPEKKFVLPTWTELGRIQLADPQYNSPNKIDILLDSEVYCSVLKKGLIKSPSGLTIAQDTYLGWVLSGKVDGYNDEELTCHNVIVNLHVRLDDNELLKKFWELEAEPSSVKTKFLTPEEQACEEYFEATTCRDDSGRYIVKLPFRSSVERDYGDSRTVAVKKIDRSGEKACQTPRAEARLFPGVG